METGAERMYWGTEYIVNQGMNPSLSEKSMRGILYGRLGDDDNPEIIRRVAYFTDNILPDIDLKDDTKARQIYLEYNLHRIDRLFGDNQAHDISPLAGALYKWGRVVDDPMTCLAVAQFFRARGMIEQALNWIDLARNAEPFSYESRDLYVSLGTVYRQAGDLGGAGQALSKALQIDPEYTPARYNAYLVEAEKSLKRQDWNAALESFRVLTEIDPHNALPYFNMAVIYERLPGRTEEALEYYQIFINKTGEQNPRALHRARERIRELKANP
jgi:tetratricopeptide (TPR) repeat protein